MIRADLLTSTICRLERMLLDAEAAVQTLTAENAQLKAKIAEKPKRSRKG